MSQELIRPIVVNQLQELPESEAIANRKEAEVITLYPYLEDTDKINENISKEYAYLERREIWRVRQFLRAVSRIEYPYPDESATTTTDMSATASEIAWENIANYRFSDGSSLPSAAFILKEFEQIDDDSTISQELDNNDLSIIAETADDADAWTDDDIAEAEFRKFINDFNNRPIMRLGHISIIEEAYGGLSGATNNSSLEPVDIVIQTEIDTVTSEEVILQMNALIEATEIRLTARNRNSKFSFLKKLLGLVE